MDESDLGPAGPRALFLSMELGVCLCRGSVAHRPAACGPGCGGAPSAASLCLGSPVVTSRAQAEVPETKTGWLREGRPREGVGLEMADPRTPRLAVQEWKPMALDPKSVGLAGRAEAGTGPWLLQNLVNNGSSNNDAGFLPSSAGLWGLPFSRLVDQAAVQRWVTQSKVPAFKPLCHLSDLWGVTLPPGDPLSQQPHP